MVDGNVVFEREFEPTAVSRDTKGVGVEEFYDFIATDKDIAALRKINGKSEILVRISGDKGYVNLNSESKKVISEIEIFKLDVISAIRIYDATSKAIEGHIPASASK
jgi:hypothetical protein